VGNACPIPGVGQAKLRRFGLGNEIRREPRLHHVRIMDTAPQVLTLWHVTGLTGRIVACSRTQLPFDERVFQRLAVDRLILRKLVARTAEFRPFEFRDAHYAAVRSAGIALSNGPGISLRRTKVAIFP
jgi:hypothetical protein